MLLARANTAQQRARDALVALAQALPTRDSSSITDKLDKAEAEQKQAKAVLNELEAANSASVSPAEARGILGDEDDEKLRKYGDMICKAAEMLEKKREQAQKQKKWLRNGHKLLLGLLTLCGVVLSLDVVRTALGVAEDSHLLLALGTLAVSCQVSVQALATSRGHLRDTAQEHRDMAQKLYERAQWVAIAKANGKAAEDIKRAIGNAQRPLDLVALWLGLLVAAVKEDMEEKEAPVQEFSEAEHKLGSILNALEKEPEGHGDMAEELKEVRAALKRQMEGTGRGHGGGAVTLRGTGNHLALGTPRPL
ncbi:hypothetical protein TURU_016838 [Turdus rufiventris]|nr:hypothetical protein TURU_016838 [Turdus rufiventris]